MPFFFKPKKEKPDNTFRRPGVERYHVTQKSKFGLCRLGNADLDDTDRFISKNRKGKWPKWPDHLREKNGRPSLPKRDFMMSQRIGGVQAICRRLLKQLYFEVSHRQPFAPIKIPVKGRFGEAATMAI